jgi:hypothetical protein
MQLADVKQECIPDAYLELIREDVEAAGHSWLSPKHLLQNGGYHEGQQHYADWSDHDGKRGASLWVVGFIWDVESVKEITGWRKTRRLLRLLRCLASMRYVSTSGSSISSCSTVQHLLERSAPEDTPKIYADSDVSGVGWLGWWWGVEEDWGVIDAKLVLEIKGRWRRTSPRTVNQVAKLDVSLCSNNLLPYPKFLVLAAYQELGMMYF